jgi:hypothetical protein
MFMRKALGVDEPNRVALRASCRSNHEFPIKNELSTCKTLLIGPEVGIMLR